MLGWRCAQWPHPTSQALGETLRGPALREGMIARCRTSSTVSPSVRARSSSRTRTMLIATEACTTATRSVSMKAGFLSAGPCACTAGEEQTFNESRVYPHTNLVGLVTCAPCVTGRFKSLGGSGAPESCEMCPPGSSSLPGATACVDCPMGTFNDYEMLECASCSPGFFSDGAGQTTCQDCAAGRQASTAHQDVGCQWCPPGTFTDTTSMTACALCSAGSYQREAGRSGCYRCSSVLDPQRTQPTPLDHDEED